MATNYRMTWRPEQGGRWRKRYKGRDYYFPRNPGESKEGSYRRCWGEWQAKKEELDQTQTKAEPWSRALTVLIDRTKARLAEIQQEDSLESRERWSLWAGQLAVYEEMLRNGVDVLADGDDPENPIPFLGGGPDLMDDPPPWEQSQVVSVSEESIAANVKRFLSRKEAQASRGERSSGRVEVLRVGLTAFVEHVGGGRSIMNLTTAVLSRYRDGLERLVDEGRLRPHSARDRLQAVKQFARWAWEEELIGLPRILESREFTITLPEQKVETFTDEEVKRLLGAATDSTRLYLLLMLNCGMTQQDIADLRQDEVDWKKGRIVRKRSKTRKTANGKGVPEVSYPLWPETFRLLKENRSEHETLALTNQNGGPLKLEKLVNGRAKKIDNVRSAYNRLLTRLENAKSDPVEITKPSKLLRKTAATRLGSNPEYARFAQHFLGHAPATVADKFYVMPTASQFDAAVSWLGSQFLA